MRNGFLQGWCCYCTTFVHQRQNHIGQAIVHAARPLYAIPLILFGLSVELNHVFGSCWLVEHLSRLGFCMSYEEVVRYKQSVLQCERAENHIASSGVSFAQWSADNVDHNSVTLDGKNTFHGMGIIVSTSTTEDNLVAALPPIARKERIPVKQLTHDKGVPIVPFEKPKKSGLQEYQFTAQSELTNSFQIPRKILFCDALRHLGWIFESDSQKHANWSGYMQAI